MMSLHPRVVFNRQVTITALPLYYSGQLLKKNKTEKDFKKYHAELRGATIFLYQDKAQDTYTEKLDLEELKSTELDSSRQRKVPATFTLRLKTGDVKLKIENSDTGEEWRCYILTVVKKEIPSKLQLLPGQVLKLQDVLTQEKRRIQPLPAPPLPPRPSFLHLPSPSAATPTPANGTEISADVPACFFNVTRQEAERMLDANPEYGGFILRPSSLTNNYAVTLRHLSPSGPIMKNYRVSSTKLGLVIELDTAVTVSSLNDVVEFFQEKTEYRLHPYMSSDPYDTRIDMPSASPQPRRVPKVQVPPVTCSDTEGLQPPRSEPVYSEYVVPYDPEDDKLAPQVEVTCAAADEKEVKSYENTCSNKKNHGHHRVVDL